MKHVESANAVLADSVNTFNLQELKKRTDARRQVLWLQRHIWQHTLFEACLICSVGHRYFPECLSRQQENSYSACHSGAKAVESQCNAGVQFEF